MIKWITLFLILAVVLCVGCKVADKHRIIKKRGATASIEKLKWSVEYWEALVWMIENDNAVWLDDYKFTIKDLLEAKRMYQKKYDELQLLSGGVVSHG